MKILMLLEGAFPFDERVEKEAVSLIEDGHEVHIACLTRTPGRKSEIYKNIHVHRIRLSKWQYKLSALILVFPYYSILWKHFVGKLFKEHEFGAIHVHDLPLSEIGVFYKQKYGCVLVCDQHEFYSDWIVNTAHYNKGFGRIVKLFSNWKKYEKKHLQQADLVITVAEPLRRIYIEQVGLNSKKVFVIPNTPGEKVFHHKNVDKNIVHKFEGNFMLFYAGGIDPLRGLEYVIDALPKLKKHIPNIKFIIAGKAIKNYDIRSYIAKKNAEELVELLGWLDISELPSYISASDICVFTPPPSRDEINNTIVTKIYQYTIMEKPIIVSQARMMKDFVEQNKIGYSVDYDNIHTFVEAVLKIYKREKEVVEMPQNCNRLKGQIIWENTIQPLLGFYRDRQEALYS